MAIPRLQSSTDSCFLRIGILECAEADRRNLGASVQGVGPHCSRGKTAVRLEETVFRGEGVSVITGKSDEASQAVGRREAEEHCGRLHEVSNGFTIFAIRPLGGKSRSHISTLSHVLQHHCWKRASYRARFGA